MIKNSGTKPKADLLIADASTLVTCVPHGGDPIGRLANASLALAGEQILAVGSLEDIKDSVDIRAATVLDAQGKIIAPGFVDSHTHLVFGGSRVQEYAAKMTHSPTEIRALGIPSGITATMEMTRRESLDQLTASASLRIADMLKHGTTTVESKSGYGLRLADEIKMLQVNHRLQHLQPVDVVSTFLGAHAYPPEIPQNDYVELVIQEMIPAVVEGKYAEFCDVYCDEGYFSVADARRILEAGEQHGLKLKIHTDQYSDLGGATMAAELGVVSADHLNYTDQKAMRRLAEAGVIGVVMPLIDFAVQHPRPFDIQALRDQGVTLAIATDLCPGGWTVSMQLVMQFACRLHRFTPEEAFYAGTVGGAKSLALVDRGTLATGQLADIQIWNIPRFEDIIYRVGNNAVETVIKRGKIVLKPEEASTRAR